MLGQNGAEYSHRQSKSREKSTSKTRTIQLKWHPFYICMRYFHGCFQSKKKISQKISHSTFIAFFIGIDSLLLLLQHQHIISSSNILVQNLWLIARLFGTHQLNFSSFCVSCFFSVSKRINHSKKSTSDRNKNTDSQNATTETTVEKTVFGCRRINLNETRQDKTRRNETEKKNKNYNETKNWNAMNGTSKQRHTHKKHSQ